MPLSEAYNLYMKVILETIEFLHILKRGASINIIGTNYSIGKKKMATKQEMYTFNRNDI